MIARYLPEGTIHCFPVRYPRYAEAAGFDLLEGRMWHGHDTREISFRDGFWQERPYENEEGEIEARIGHGAIDIYGAFHCQIRATVGGTVPDTWVAYERGSADPRPGVGFIDWSPENRRAPGHYVMIRDEQGFYHMYSHMAGEPDVEVGDTVRTGQLIGRLGDSGLRRRTQHLHCQTTRRPGRTAVNYDPFRELRRLAFDTLPEYDVRENAGGTVFVQMARE
jgi:murein DD-endopeptidase MepM/ murein hydrolase activator NlpD